MIAKNFFISFSRGSCISRFNKFLNSKLKIHPPSLRYGATRQKLVPLLLDWFAANARDLPWRKTRDPYAIWVSEIMLQQTQVKTVLPYWNRWMRELPTIESVAKASPDKIHKLWEGLGYYTRVRNLQKAAQQIIENCRRRGNESQSKGERQKAEGRRKIETPYVVSYEFPKNFADVLALPGIGHYTAGAICSIAFNQPTPILDGNVIRVLTRIFGIAQDPKEKKTNQLLWNLAEQLVSCANEIRWGERPRELDFGNQKRTAARGDARPTGDNSCSFLNQSLMELGALVCTPRNPSCESCPAKKLCVAFKEKRTEELPNLGKRAVAMEKHIAAFLIERNGKFLVRRRPAGIVNAHLWEFPNVEMVNGNSNPKLAAKNFLEIRPTKVEHFYTLKHSITRYRITLEAFQVRVKKFPAKTKGVWLSPKEFGSFAFAAAHRKILDVLTQRQAKIPGCVGSD